MMRLKHLIIALLCLPLAAGAQTNGKKITKIVLDAGHGGSDAGAIGNISKEKDLTLAITLKLGKLIGDSLKGVQTLYTRVNDTYPSLQDRHEIANQSKADLFVSIHINSTAGTTERVQAGTRVVKKKKKKVTVPVYKVIRHRETSQQGTMTLVLGSIRNNEKSRAVGEYGDNIVDEPGLLNESDPQTAIIIAQYTKAFLGRSVSLGTKIQDAFNAVGRRDHGVKQQSLEVLAGSYMPGVLVECGFINNPEEEEFLNSERGQLEIAQAIFRGIKAYKQEAEAGN